MKTTDNTIIECSASTAMFAELFGIGQRVMRGIIERAIASGLIAKRSSNTGSVFGLMQKGARYCDFKTENAVEFAELRKMLRSPFSMPFLYIIGHSESINIIAK